MVESHKRLLDCSIIDVSSKESSHERFSGRSCIATVLLSLFFTQLLSRSTKECLKEYITTAELIKNKVTHEFFTTIYIKDLILNNF